MSGSEVSDLIGSYWLSVPLGILCWLIPFPFRLSLFSVREMSVLNKYGWLGEVLYMITSKAVVLLVSGDFVFPMAPCGDA